MENRQALAPLQILWDYLGMHQKPEQADCIVGFGNFNDNIARRAAELYRAGYAPYVLFTGGLGRNTLGLLPEPEAVRFARVATECGVPEANILIEDKSTNTAENIRFTRALLEERGLPPWEDFGGTPAVHGAAHHGGYGGVLAGGEVFCYIAAGDH